MTEPVINDRDESSEALPLVCRVAAGPALPLVLVDDRNLLSWPPQPLCPLG